MDSTTRQHGVDIKVNVPEIILGHFPLRGCFALAWFAFRSGRSTYVDNRWGAVKLGLFLGIKSLHHPVPFTIHTLSLSSDSKGTFPTDRDGPDFDQFHCLLTLYHDTARAHPIFRGLQPGDDVFSRKDGVAAEPPNLYSWAEGLVTVQVAFQHVSVSEMEV